MPSAPVGVEGPLAQHWAGIHKPRPAGLCPGHEARSRPEPARRPEGQWLQALEAGGQDPSQLWGTGRGNLGHGKWSQYRDQSRSGGRGGTTPRGDAGVGLASKAWPAPVTLFSAQGLASNEGLQPRGGEGREHVGHSAQRLWPAPGRRPGGVSRTAFRLARSAVKRKPKPGPGRGGCGRSGRDPGLRAGQAGPSPRGPMPPAPGGGGAGEPSPRCGTLHGAQAGGAWSAEALAAPGSMRPDLLGATSRRPRGCP